MTRIHIEAHKIACVGYRPPTTANETSAYLARFANALRKIRKEHKP